MKRKFGYLYQIHRKAIILNLEIIRFKMIIF
jgi:hypothetical protein